MKRIDVTCAILINNNMILACQRKSDTGHPLEWEFPGGKIDDGETATDCIIRELKEELEIDINVCKALTPVDHDYLTIQVKLIPFLCQLVDGIPKPLEHNEIRWIEIEQFDELQWSAADAKLFLINKNEIARWL